MKDFAVVGLGVMGENLILNLERNGISVAVYNRSYSKVEDFLQDRAKGKAISGMSTLQELVKSLSAPRRILLMVKAGRAVDAVLEELVPLLSPGDVVIDGGNSLYTDTDRRYETWKGHGIHFFGMGVSGGEEGALNGPSLMPGGDRAAYESLQPILEKIAAKTDSGPCVTYVGAKSAGHFVKMVHNGIEYGDMQLIAECYDLLRHALGLSLDEIQQLFEKWNQDRLSSYLIEITARVVNAKDDLGSGKPLIDLIVDSAGQKGTGKWTTMSALDLGISIPTITAAVDARLISAKKEERQKAAQCYPRQIESRENSKEWIPQIEAALYLSKICSYAQGFSMLKLASEQFQYQLDLSEIARIWKGGCIIRAIFLDRLRQTFQEEISLSNLLVAKTFQDELKKGLSSWRNVVKMAIDQRIAVPAISASLNYFESYTRERLPANLIQAQRDFFGAHTFERVDKSGFFHAKWE
ncbi:MAG: NADP-dependent phosphogluconate dehydrogenase [Verrucomicrobiae bacterium]|nr:NADP-dependent phosphogluconate dehydrogenase [Verrucomicrobiae bacterium]